MPAERIHCPVPLVTFAGQVELALDRLGVNPKGFEQACLLVFLFLSPFLGGLSFIICNLWETVAVLQALGPDKGSGRHVDDSGLSSIAILRGLKKKGIHHPTPIQIQGIPTM